MSKRHKFIQFVLSNLIIFSIGFSATQPQPASAQDGDGIKRQVNAESGKVSFIGPENGRAVPASKALGTFIRPQDPAMALAKRFAPEFGLTSPDQNLSVKKSDQLERGRLKVRYQQNFQGIPVMGGELMVNTNTNGDLYSINGEVSPNLTLSTQPAIDSEQAKETSLQAVAKWYQKSSIDFIATEPELWIYDESLLRSSTRPAELVWRMEVTSANKSLPVRELVLINAQRGNISLHFNQVDTAWTTSGSINGNDIAQDTTPTETPTETQLPTETPIPSETVTPIPTNSLPPTQVTTRELSSDEAVALAGATWYVATTGNASNSCSTVGSPCLTINGAITKATNGDTIKVAIGTYTGTGTEVVLINKSITLSGGWNASFATQGGQSTIDGQGARRGMTVNSGVTAIIERSVVQNGNATSDSGGGIYNNSSATVNLNNSTVSGNIGWGIDNRGTLTLNNSIVSGSTDTGIFNWSALTLNNSSTSNNNGTGITNNGTVTTLIMNNSTINNNIDVGIHNVGGTLTLNNSTISGNGGTGLYNTGGGTSTLNNSTVSDNMGLYSGGIVRHDGTVILKNTIIAGNSSTYNGPDCVGPITSAGYNLIGDSTDCMLTSSTGDLTDVSPNLGELTGSPGYHLLQAGSPAINTGNPAAPGSGGNACLATDQRGVIRPVGGRCDIGAYEYTAPGSLTRLSIFSGDGQYVGPGLAFPNPLKVVALDSQGSPVPSVSVTFTAPESGASGTFANTSTRITTVMTDAGGIATTPAFTANTLLGSYTVVASTSGVASVNFHLQNGFWHVATTGTDTNDCLTPATPCGTINGAIGKANNGDTIQVAIGTYTGTGTEVMLVNKSITLLGGWNSNFTTQSGLSVIDGQGARRGVTTTGTTVVIDRFTVQNGFDSIRGAGLFNDGSTLTLSNSIISGNISDGMGGGISNIGTLTINNTSINNNRAGTPFYSGGGGGAGIQNQSGTLTLNNSTISDNLIMGSFSGSGMSAFGTAILNNSTVSGNSGGTGEGIYTFTGTILLNNSTISGNQSYGIRNQAGMVTLKNTILAGNGIEGDCYNDTNGYSGTITSQGYNLIGNTFGCTLTPTTGDLVNVNANLGQLIGSPGYIPLLPGSPAIDAGNPATPGGSGNACLADDQRGVARPIGTRCDIGAYEYEAAGNVSSLFIVSGNRQRAAPFLAFSQPLKVAALDSRGSPVPNVSITFTAPSSGASGIFTNTGTRTTTVLTDIKGIATTPIFIANANLGAYTVTASASGAGSVNLSLQNFALYVATTGNNSNSCLFPSSPCATIQGAVNKAESRDTILITTGRYTSSVFTVVYIDRGVALSGGWNTAFTAQIGLSTIDGQNTRQGVYIYMDPSMSASLDRFIVENGTYHSGGGIHNPGGKMKLTITNSSIQNNSATSFNGGGIYNNGKLTLINTTVSNNSADYGGGIDNYPFGNLTLNNSTVSNNSAYYGGGIYNEGNLTLNNSTVSNNSAYYGGGIYGLSGTITLRNSIVARNIATPLYPEYSYPDCYGTMGSSGYNLIGNNLGCTFNATIGDLVGTSASTINAKLTPLQDNGGPTFTHALMEGSPAINAGNLATPGSGNSTCLSTDQRGIVRPVGGRCDIGAYEGSVSWAPSPSVHTYTANDDSSLPGFLLCNETDPSCASGDAHAKAAHKFAIGTYNFYATQHARDSIDDNGMTIISSVHYNTVHCIPACPYYNAFWDGTQIAYGDGYGFPLADDVVAHEFTHGITQYESNLFYYYQSGAINESFSDLWGEYYDQTNGLGNDTAGVKWLHGEDVSGRGAARSMSNPPAYGHPDKMSSANYYEGQGDGGGVHTNSGVNNKAVFLMVDGGTFNGKTITALGWVKTAAIYYEVNTNLLSSGADYSDLYYALQQACSNLIGQNGITSGDCAEVKEAIDAVEMNSQPAPNFNPDAPLCDAGISPTYTFTDDLEAGTSNWAFNNGAYTRWQVDSPFFGPFAQSGVHSLYADDYPDVITDASARLASFTVPVNGYLHFDHAYEFEAYLPTGPYYFDGGVLEYSTNGGASWFDASPLIDFNGYRGVVFTGGGNPLSGRWAFVGTSHGYISTRLNLAGFVGKTVTFRWRMGLDQGTYFGGWWVDNIKVYSCIHPNHNIDVMVGNTLTGRYYLPMGSSMRQGYSSVDSGPVKIKSTNSANILSALRVIWKEPGFRASYSEIMGLPVEQLSTEYWFPWYNNAAPASMDQGFRIGNVNSTSTAIQVWVGTTLLDSFTLNPGASTRVGYNVDNGPIRIVCTDCSGSEKIIAAMRVIWKEPGMRFSYSEMMGLPKEQLSSEYWFPWYNNAVPASMDQGFRIANVSSTESNTVEVWVGTTKLDTLTLGSGASTRVGYNVDNGPIRIVCTTCTNTGDDKIIAALRVIWKEPGFRASYSEMMGLPKEQLSDEYWFPWYNNAATNSMDQGLRIANVSSTESNTVEVWVGSTKLATIPLAAGASTRVGYNVDNGPIRIVCTTCTNTNYDQILAALRVIWKEPGFRASYSEMMGLPAQALSTEYWFPWYNFAAPNSMDQGFRIAVP